ncbi:RNA 2'-phosphotransferase [Paenibacillus sp. YSY-4.3]
MRQSKPDVELGRFLSLILRHNPGAVGIKLDANGWADVKELLAGLHRAGRAVNMATLERIVRENSKQRYSFNEDHSKIRANQGHSLAVDVELKVETPPEYLYHGTAALSVDSIRKQGITKQSRQHVHLTEERETATRVGGRHGKPVVLTVRAGAMHRDGFIFYRSENQVWLCDHVPWEYINVK